MEAAILKIIKIQSLSCLYFIMFQVYNVISIVAQKQVCQTLLPVLHSVTELFTCTLWTDALFHVVLFQEAFKAVEDVYGLMQLSKRPPKPQVMANYYQKVALVFWKAENYLFHACTLHRLYVLSREQKRTMTNEEHQK